MERNLIKSTNHGEWYNICMYQEGSVYTVEYWSETLLHVETFSTREEAEIEYKAGLSHL